jgi:hypothetical protein
MSILFTDVSANPLHNLAVGIIFDGHHDVNAILFDADFQLTVDEFHDIISPIVSRGLRGARIGVYEGLILAGIQRDIVTHPSSTDCEVATFRASQMMPHDAIVGDSVAVEKLAIIDGEKFIRMPGHGSDTPTNLKVADRLSRRVLRRIIKYIAQRIQKR